jgi:uncharacterized membrane protein (UPF0182 family)
MHILQSIHNSPNQVHTDSPEICINIKSTFKAHSMKKIQIDSNASSGYKEKEEKINRPQ